MSKDMICLDTECYPNYWMIAFKSIKTGKVIIIDTDGGNYNLGITQRKRLRSIMKKFTTFGYNSLNYDLPMIELAISGASCHDLYMTSKGIVENGTPSWSTYKQLNIESPNYDHIDIKEPAPAVMISLKNYGTRLGSVKLWDLPYDPHTKLSSIEIQTLKKYCENDLDTTIDLYKAIEDRIELRTAMGKEMYSGIEDLRSKSDAQVAEAIFKFELGKKGIKIPYMKAQDRVPKRVKYKAPDFIKFETDGLNKLLELFNGATFDIKQSNGQPILPKEWAKQLKPKIGNTTYKLGLGGIHSQEKKLVIESNEDFVLRNADVASYYPSMILEFGLFPRTLGKEWLDIYRNLYDTRLEAKATGNKVVNGGLKIALNGSYGKLGSMYSFLYAPDLMLSVTITGQLMLLMLIEQLELHGINVVSSNTDGIEYFCPREEVDFVEALIYDWELETGMIMEHGEYKGLYAKDVNNYIAVYDGYVKSKGLYGETTLMKGRSTPIVYKAIRKYLLNGSKLETTICNCKDINEFVSGRTVKGGGAYIGEYLGKVVRWYYSTKSSDCIMYSTNGNKVPKTDGAKPLMDLPNELPLDLNWDWYIDEAISKLADLGIDYVN